MLLTIVLIFGCIGCGESELMKRRKNAINFNQEHYPEDKVYIKALKESTEKSLKKLNLLRAYWVVPGKENNRYLYLSFFGDNPACDKIRIKIGNKNYNWDIDKDYTAGNKLFSKTTICYHFFMKLTPDDDKLKLINSNIGKNIEVTLMNKGKPVSNSQKLEETNHVFPWRQKKNKSQD